MLSRSDAKESLKSYVGLYLQREIQAEALTRNLQAFSRFLAVMALNNGGELNYSGLASDCAIPTATFRNYIEILDDTLLGFMVPAYARTKKRKAIQRAKYYLFDVGVNNVLARRGAILARSELFGRAFEHFIVQELRAYLSYRRLDAELSYWRSTSMFEVEIVLEDLFALEIKSTDTVVDKHLKGLRALKEEKLFPRYIVVSLDREQRKTADGIHILSWQIFLKKLWSHQFVA